MGEARAKALYSHPSAPSNLAGKTGVAKFWSPFTHGDPEVARACVSHPRPQQC